MNDSVWCCAKKARCKWQGFALHQGLAWGTVPPPSNTWRQWHDRECGGELVQLLAPGGQSAADEVGQLRAEVERLRKRLPYPCSHVYSESVHSCNHCGSIVEVPAREAADE